MKFARMKAFVDQDGKEIEVYKNFETEKDMLIQMRVETREREFKLGDPLKIDASDFDDIAFTCWQFGSQLAQQLPKLPIVAKA